ncbi:MAG TPA: hypothetical protein VFS43_31695 [Polyangiaceae bacterium]|nr:hypothetical protein [Polyangiaceae bacterium]
MKHGVRIVLLAGLTSLGCGAEPPPEEGGVAAAEGGAVVAAAGGGLGAPGAFDAQYIDCDEFAGVGLAPIANVDPRVPDDSTVIEAVPGSAIVVAQAATCEQICVGGEFCREATFAQFGVGVAPPGGAPGSNFYQLVFVTDHPILAARLRLLGVNAVFTPKIEYEITPESELFVSVPRPKSFAFELSGPITLPDPNAPPNPVSTFNYWYGTDAFGNVLQQNVVTGIRFGEGSGVVLTAIGPELQAVLGGTTLTFPFFAAPEVFDRADVSVQTNVF